MTMRRTLAALATASAMAAAGVASAADIDKVTVAYFLEWPTANQVAQLEKTYDKEMGVTVEWRAFGNGNEMSQAMASGDVDIAYSQGLVPFVVAYTNGLPLRTVGVAVSYAAADNCVVRDDAGITKENAKKLEGRKIATPIGNVTHYKLLRVLEHLGVDASKVQFVQMNGADAAVALARGDVVMACAFGGPLERMKEYGHVLMTAEEQEAIGIRVFDVVSVTDGFLKEHPDLVKTFLRVTDEANKAYNADPEPKIPVICKAAGMDLEPCKKLLSMFTFPTAEEQKSEKWLGGTVQKFMKEVADFFVKQGQLDHALDSYDSAVDASYLP